MANRIITRSSTGQLSRNPDFPASTDIEASMAVLVADGALPTQAHVTTAAADLAAFLAANVVSQAGQVFLSYATTLTQNQIKVAMRAIEREIEGIA